MARRWNWAEDLVMRVQTEFLNSPGLALARGEAARVFAIDRTIADAILSFLSEAGVLTETTQGLFTRRVPALVVSGVPMARSARGRTAARMSPRVSHAA